MLPISIFAHIQSISRKPQSNGTRESGVFGGSSHHRQFSYGSTIDLDKVLYDEVLNDEFFRKAVDADASVDLRNLDYRRNDNGIQVRDELACVGESSASYSPGMNGVQNEGALCMVMQHVQPSLTDVQGWGESQGRSNVPLACPPKSERSASQRCAPWKRPMYGMCDWAAGIMSKFLVCLSHPIRLPLV